MHISPPLIYAQGANTLYWIENGIFQTSVPYVVPYLDKFLASE